MATVRITAAPHDIEIDPARTGVVIVDMQRDFLQARGFGKSLGNDVSQLGF